MAWKKVITSGHGVNELNDVDTTSSAAVSNDVLKWNGANWVPAQEGEVVTFESVSLKIEDDSQAGLNSEYLIGGDTDVWKNAGEVNFILDLVNGAANAGKVTCSTANFTANEEAFTNFSYSTGGDAVNAWADNTNDMTYPDGAGGSASTAYGWIHSFVTSGITNSAGATAANKSDTLRFSNYVKWGAVSSTSQPSVATILALSGSAITNNTGFNANQGSAKDWVNQTIGAGEYFCFAAPKRIAEDENLVLMDADENQNLDIVNEAPYTVSVLNGNGKTEDYSVYISTASNLGSFKLKTYGG